ncbi:Cleavage and polyadenylation specificity factor subunit 1 [Kappamyces sp. JEL0680]|nr:Cleavage and polyadenylation specificity factor subunit 1 [Kappamyces sp. JEL0680]
MVVYSLNKQLTPPTCITHSLKCHFTHPQKLDLLIVKGNLLCCYRIYTTAQGDCPTARLELLHEFALQGIVTSIGTARSSAAQHGLDSLLLTFQDAKMSIVEYSVFTQNLVTVSMHNYEREEFRKDLAYKGVPSVKVDHQSRCAVMRFYRQQFAILPFKYDSGIGDDDEQK